MKKTGFALAFAFVIMSGSFAFGSPILSIGDYLVDPGTFTVDLFIEGITDEEITDFSFRMDIVPGDGTLKPSDSLDLAPGGALPYPAYLSASVDAAEDTVSFFYVPFVLQNFQNSFSDFYNVFFLINNYQRTEFITA